MKWGVQKVPIQKPPRRSILLGGFPVLVRDNFKNPWIYVEGGKCCKKAIGGCSNSFLPRLISLPSIKEEEQ